ncbi:hypothetical protein G6683_08790 [Polynucleobacter paneuropaeus]|jgi:hypothetical protein|nr:hypothetical protein [Polynucleobacter paneuropaeus]
MPKLNATHIPERLREAIEQLERGEEVEAKKNKTLLTEEQKKALDDAWTKQQSLRKKHKPPKTEEEKIKLGWKDKREVRIEIFKQALAGFEGDIHNIHLKQLEKEQAQATKAYLKGYFGATGLQDKHSAGKIAVTQAGFTPSFGGGIVAKRDREIRDQERQILEGFGDDLTEEQREHLEWLKEGKKKVKKAKKG